MEVDMNKKELRKLKRIDLFEIMLAQSEEIDRLRAELETLKKQLEDKRILLEKRGTLAEASLALTNIFEEAQKAADLYLYNIESQANVGGFDDN